jgi:hypothetical protein
MAKTSATKLFCVREGEHQQSRAAPDRADAAMMRQRRISSRLATPTQAPQTAAAGDGGVTQRKGVIAAAPAVL